MITSAPTSVKVDGAIADVRRAWPASPDSLIIEVAPRDGGHVRAGRWTRGRTDIEPAASDHRLPALSRWRDRGTVVVHRLGKRAVIRQHDGAAYTKITRPGRAGAVVAAIDRAAPFRAGFALAGIRRHDEETVVFDALGGPTLHELAATATGSAWARAWSEWAAGWLAVAARPVPETGGSLPVHDAQRESEIVRSWSGHVRDWLGPAASVDLDAAATQITDRLLGGEPERLVLAHRDLHDKQVVVTDSAIGLLDVDTVARAEAALDLGNLRAHVALRRSQGVYTDGQAATAHVMITTVADELDVSPERLADYELASTLRLGCLYAFRPQWADVARRLRAGVIGAIGAAQSSSVAPQPK